MNTSFQLALIGSFFAYLYQPACDLVWEIYIIFYADNYYRPSDESFFPKRKTPFNYVSCVIFVLMELTIFVSIIGVGCKYILTSNNASNLVQAALSIVFISVIDDQLFKVMISKGFLSSLEI